MKINTLLGVFIPFIYLYCNQIPPKTTQLPPNDTSLTSTTTTKPKQSQTPTNVNKLIAAYPNHLSHFQDNKIYFKDGSSLIYDDGKTNKTFQELLDNPDIEDQFRYTYQIGGMQSNPAKNEDPGRIRNEAFFKKIYGSDKEIVRKKLKEITWCPKLVNQKILVTTENEVDKLLTQISAELDQLPAYKEYLKNIGGTFNWRLISGTNRLSMHSFGMTLDLNTAYSHYWQWDCKCTNEQANLGYKNKIPQEGIASGSGVIISANGYIATNNHVVDGAADLEVTLLDNRSFKAKVVGTDPSTDLALLKIEGDELPYLEVGNSDDLKVGEWVIAIGNPMELTSTVTAGIVSAKGRDIRLLDGNYRIESFIQTDAVVNRGNSGGALINTSGELVGINTAIASRTGYYSGYSFAVPAAIVKKVMEDLLQYGEVRRGILGIRIDNVDAKLAEEKDLAVLKGAYVASVNSGSGAAKAGLKEGDVIISIDGKTVNSSSELQEQVGRHRPNDKVTIKYLRGDKEAETTITLQNIEEKSVAFDNQPTPKQDSDDESAPEAPSGEAKFRNLTSSEKADLDIANGVMIESPGSKLARGGIKKGFIITKVNGKPVSNPSSLEKELENTKGIIKIEGLYDRNTSIMFSFPW